MNIINEIWSRGIEQLFGRTIGPLNFRLIVMPVVASVIAIRAGLKDAREGQPIFLWGIFTNPIERKRLVRSGWKDIGRIIIVALVLDTVYQLIVFRAFYVVQALIVALMCAVIPYVLIRGVTTRLARGFYGNSAREADRSATEKIRHVDD